MVLSTSEGDIVLTAMANGRALITLNPRNPGLYVPRWTCETSHPDEVELFLQSGCSFAWLCDAVSRHEDPECIQAVLRRQLFAYVGAEAFKGRRLLDFGCGGGASTFCMAAFLPETEIVGLELEPQRVDLCQRIAVRRRAPNIRFLLSPSGDRLPSGIGHFAFIMLSAVYEHLLPKERKVLMPQLWALLNPGGVLFINQTPHRWVPYEHHSTGLWGINYLPDRWAHWYARNFSKLNPEGNSSSDWSVHLRRGLRGATEREIVGNLTAGGENTRAVILQPTAGSFRDRADYWLNGTSPRFRALKLVIASAFRLSDRLFDTIPAFNVDVAIRKELR